MAKRKWQKDKQRSTNKNTTQKTKDCAIFN